MPGRFANLEFEHEHEPEQVPRRRQQHNAPPQQAPELLARAHAACRWGEFEAALRLYTRTLTEDRAAVPAWVGQVQMLVQLDECREARMWSDKALELFRNNGELLAAKSQACARLNDIKSALACSDAALQAPGSSPWRWEVRGEALLAKRQSHYEQCFQRALIEPAADWFDRVVIARIHAFYGRVTNALHLLNEAVAMEPTHGFIWHELGYCQRKLGLLPAAQTSFERCLEIRPDYQPAQAALDELTSGVPLTGWLRGVVRRWRRQ
ncbi:MAG: tetratricopeptide repeat protein [Planctomycetes bacterium]|nr:tetratricopeptide repeat protein [Planctomycetota bacterium]